MYFANLHVLKRRQIKQGKRAYLAVLCVRVCLFVQTDGTNVSCPAAAAAVAAVSIQVNVGN